MQMSDYKLVMTPVVPSSHLIKADKYEEACRSATELTTHREPIVSYAVGTLARFSIKPMNPTG